MKPRMQAQVMAGRVTLMMSWGGMSVCCSVEPDDAEAFAAEMRVAAGAIKARLGEVTRPMCRACWRDCSACVCGEKGAA